MMSLTEEFKMLSRNSKRVTPVRSFDELDEEAEREGSAVKAQGESGSLGRPPKGKTIKQVQNELRVVEVARYRILERPRNSFRTTGI